MRLRYAWADLPWMIVAIVLLIPLLVQLVEIVVDFAASCR